MSESQLDRYAVIGNPIEHSKSPDIHLLFADQTGEQLHYEKILADENKFSQVVSKFFADGGKGLNVTVPFKNDACAFVDELTDYAKNAGAVNTIYKNDDGRFIGANTDGIGLLRDLKKTLRVPIINTKILIVGAGGATQGIVEPLLNEQPAELIITNRTVSKADAITQQFKDVGNITSCALDDIPKHPFDLVLHATSAGLQGNNVELPSEIVGPTTCCYDLLYSDQDTPFMAWAKNHHAGKVVDGFGMLLEQAAEAFYIWRGQRPDTGMAYHYFRPDLAPKPSL
ncbi:MAG: shikimate dehydrogenase [Gammaproteobacteria bacterium]